MLNIAKGLKSATAEIHFYQCWGPHQVLLVHLSLQNDKQNCISSSQKKRLESHQELLPVASISLKPPEIPHTCYDFLWMSSAYHWTGMDNYPFRTGQQTGRVRNRQCAPSNVSLQEHKTSISTQILLRLLSAWKADSEARKGRGRNYTDNRACRQHVKHSGAPPHHWGEGQTSIRDMNHICFPLVRKTCFSLNVSLGNRGV